MDFSFSKKIYLSTQKVYRGEGFSIVEILIAISIVLVAILGSSLAFNFAVQSTSKSSDRVKLDSLIEADFARLNAASNNYTFCTGGYTWDGRACGSATPGQQNYYFPPTTSISTVSADQFSSDCNDGTMTDSLVDAINGDDASLGLSQAAIDQGIERQAVPDGTSHRIKIAYSIDSSSYRELAIVPLAAGWCP